MDPSTKSGPGWVGEACKLPDGHPGNCDWENLERRCGALEMEEKESGLDPNRHLPPNAQAARERVVMLISEFVGAACVLAVDVFAASAKEPSTPKRAMKFDRERWSAAERKEPQADLVSAYLQGEVETGEVIYKHQPSGHPVNGEDRRPRICEIIKPVYGMRQGGRRLQRKQFPWMLAWMDGKFTQVEADACIFMAREVDDPLIVTIYVDDACCIYLAEGESSLYGKVYRDFHA